MRACVRVWHECVSMIDEPARCTRSKTGACTAPAAPCAPSRPRGRWRTASCWGARRRPGARRARSRPARASGLGRAGHRLVGRRPGHRRLRVRLARQTMTWCDDLRMDVHAARACGAWYRDERVVSGIMTRLFTPSSRFGREINGQPAICQVSREALTRGGRSAGPCLPRL